MRRTGMLVGLAQAAILAGFGCGLAGRWFPLGVPGEWEWLRLPASATPDPLPLALAALAVAGLAGLAAAGARALARGGSMAREAAWVAALAAAAVPCQGVVQEGAPQPYGLAKWIIALHNSGSSGYHTVARTQMPAGLGAFLRDYPAWIRRQDSLHIGTHPPGLFVAARGLDDLARREPALARSVVALAPGSVGPAIRLYGGNGTLARDEAAALALTGALTLLGSALTVVPVYLLARAGAAPPVAWAAAALWPLLPAAILFQPTADTAFPLLSTSALAAAAWAARSPRGGTRGALAILAGVLLAVGMELTLAYLAVGLVAALVLLGTPGPRGWPSRVPLVGLVGLGFVAATAAWWGATGANPVAVWWANQEHHAQFYRDYPRSRLAWAGANLAESAVAVGLATAAWAALGLARPRTIPAPAWATVAVLALLTASGRSLSEVARLWLPLYPPVLLAAAAGWDRSAAGPGGLAWTVALVGTQTLLLQTLIQVVYPV